MDTVVLEIADGLIQRETEALLVSPCFSDGVDGVIFAAGDALAAFAGAAWLARTGLPVLGLSGVLTGSPLAMREAELATGLPVFTIDLLRDHEHANRLLQVPREVRV